MRTRPARRVNKSRKRRRSMRNATAKTAPTETQGPDEIVSYFDINQLELAFINRALKGIKDGIPAFVEIGKSERILQIQKRNLEILCQKRGKEYRPGTLEGELKKILSGAKIFTMFRR